tara:strand:+ start:779 stop:1090 length:312 start_codon:yes stop_codon:yes gene_type:complete
MIGDPAWPHSVTGGLIIATSCGREPLRMTEDRKPLNPNDPLHGVKLEQIVTQLFEHYGWEALAAEVNVNCFKNDPSVKSSLKFLRKTPWARAKVERLYLDTFL